MFEEFYKHTQKRLDSKREINNPYSQMTESTKRALFERFERMFRDPIEFYKCVRTLDESAKSERIRAFPWRLEYLQFYIQALQTFNKIAVPKSRRMKISWTTLTYITYDHLFNVGKHTAAVSKKEQDSDKLVERCEFILKNLDPELFPKELIPKFEKTFCKLELPELMSLVTGYPSGADQLRQHGFSRIMGDEFAFWPNAEAMYSGAKPTLEGSDGGGGGQMILISSRSPGFFKRLVYDRMDDAQDFLYETALSNVDSPLIGVECWKNPKNGFFVIELHYTADPAKRSEEWRVREASGIPKAQWDREYEKSWDTYEGLPVYQDFVTSKHTSRYIKPDHGLPLLRGWDFGLTPACVVAQQQGEQLVILKEFTEFNMGTDRFSELVLPQCNAMFPGFKWIDFIDPAGMNRDQSDEGQSAAVLDSKGLMCIPGAMTWEPRRKAVEHFLLGWSPKLDQPNLLIDPGNCPILVRGFQGGYRYPDTVVDREPNKIRPFKDEHSHAHDALQYLASGILSSRRPGARSRRDKRPSYQKSETGRNLSRSYFR